MTTAEIATQISHELSKQGLKEFAHRQMCDAMDRMCQRFQPGYKETYKGQLWSLAQELHKEMAAKVRAIVSKTLSEQESQGFLTIGDTAHVDAEGQPTGVVRQGDLLASAIQQLNDIKDDRDVPAATRASVTLTLAKYAEKHDVEVSRPIVETFAEAWPDALEVAALKLHELTQLNIARLSGGKAGAGAVPEAEMPEGPPDLEREENREPDY